MAKGNIKLKVKIEAQRLYKAIEKMKKLTPQKATEVVRDAGVFFVQSAQKATPPDTGKTNISRKKYYRGIIDLRGTGNKSRYKVPFRGMYKRGARFFKYKNAAKAFSYIKYRGMSRAGWYANLLDLGEKIFNFKTTPEALHLGKIFSAVRWFGKNTSRPIVQVENNVPSIEKYAAYSKSFGLGRAANRLNFLARKMKTELEASGNVAIR